MAGHEVLRVELGERGYNILIGKSLIKEAGSHIVKVLPAKKVFIVTDDNIAKIYLDQLEKSLDDSGIKYSHYIIPHGEGSKSFGSLEKLLDKVFAEKPDRKTTLIALGGGVVGDLTGFAASIILRGINFIQIPTTLLAQVDSSVGGKTGINNSYGKNLVGAFHQPLLVLADTGCISSLPKREFLAGYAEVVKYGVIGDKKLFDYLEGNLAKLLQYDDMTLQYVISESCKAKAKIVAEDEKEGGKRALLNLGHTLAHALEKETGYGAKLLHGEAVAIGMVFALLLSHKMGLCDSGDVQKLAQHFKEAGLKISPLEVQKDWDLGAIMEAMYQDKKAFDGKLTFILSRKIGASFIEKNVDEKMVKSVVEEFFSS